MYDGVRAMKERGEIAGAHVGSAKRGSVQLPVGRSPRDCHDLVDVWIARQGAHDAGSNIPGRPCDDHFHDDAPPSSISRWPYPKGWPANGGVRRCPWDAWHGQPTALGRGSPPAAAADVGGRFPASGVGGREFDVVEPKATVSSEASGIWTRLSKPVRQAR